MDRKLSNTSLTTCDRCGELVSPPSVPHTRRACGECDRFQYRTAIAGEGLRVAAGDQVVIPAGALRISIDPREGGKLYRPGLSWFVQNMFFGDHASTSEGIGESLQKYEKTADHTLEASVLLEGLNLEEAGDAESAFTRIGDNFRLPEYWAVRLGVAVRLTEEAIEEGDAAKAAWAMQLAALSRCMLLFLRQLEELAWRGYRTFGVEELQQALEVWESAAPDANESFWQRTLAEHSFVLSQLFSAPTLVIHDQAYVGGKQVDNREGQVTDFLAQNALTGSVALIEIKKPTSALLGRRYRNGVYAASAELVGAIAQAEGNRDTLVKEFYVHARGQADFFPYDPPAVVVIGHTRTLDTEEKRRSFELFRRGLKDIRVATFDETFGQARSLLELIRRTPGGAAANDG